MAKKAAKPKPVEEEPKGQEAQSRSDETRTAAGCRPRSRTP